MMEIHNGLCQITISVNGFKEHSAQTIISNGQMADDNATAKPQKKRVSFHDNVTDIDNESEEDLDFENGNKENQLETDDKSLKEELEGILNVSEKINFFKSAFADDGTKARNDFKPLGHQSSIPQARLAFVTGMVESSLAGSNLREVRVDSNAMPNVVQEDSEDTKVRESVPDQVTCCADELNPPEHQSVNEMTATQVTFTKIFATPKTKTSNETVVDTSSILEHREEIRELWEKRMMADDNQSSPSSSTVEAPSTKLATEEGKEEMVLTTNSESETKPDHKLSNGFAKVIESNNIEDSNANHINDVAAKENNRTEKTADSPASSERVEIDHDNNNCADSLEEDNTDDYVEEKTYTSETSLVIKSESVEVTTEEIVQITTEEHVSEDLVKKEIALDENEITVIEAEVADKVDGISSVEETVVTNTVEKVSSEKVSENDAVTDTKTGDVKDSKIEVSHEIAVKEATDEKCIKALEIPDCTDEDGDGFVRIEECLPIGDNSVDTDHEVFTEEQRNEISNGSEEHPDTPSLPPTPDSALGDKLASPEIEQFVKSGGLKRVLPGVQKTEQPYSTCTTETKIAMEIREMREREEELRIMREQALLSPVVSPVPPKSPRSPSPSLKESPSPVPSGAPSPGCGYRVSSVFGHKGSTSPSPSVIAEEEKLKGFSKGFAKESAVEKEIRLARDREEELRKQKGLPPREDDSYVKPSQVKSSQVRVFGKVVGSNNVKQAATAKIQLEIEEQTQREMALRDTGSIQTISQERTDAKVAKLKAPEVTKPAVVNGQNGNSHPVTNGNHTNGRSSPDVAPYKRGSPSPNGIIRPANIFSQANGGSKANGISMHKFIASKGKETTFVAPAKNGVMVKEDNNKANVPPNMIKLKRTVSVESKIQQEIMEMKQREEELKLLHMNRSNENSLLDEDIMEHEMNQKNNFREFENGNGVHDEDISPRHNKLIAQWEQRIQKAES